MNKILPIILLVVLSACAVQPYSIVNKDPITNDSFEMVRASCANEFFCTGFGISNKKKAYLYIGYWGDDWMYVESVEMKNNRTGQVIKHTGEFDREVLSPSETSKTGRVFNFTSEVTVTEIARMNLDKKTYDFIKSSLGDKVTLVINGSKERIYTTTTVSSDPKADGHKKLWWAYFISRFKM